MVLKYVHLTSHPIQTEGSFTALHKQTEHPILFFLFFSFFFFQPFFFIQNVNCGSLPRLGNYTIFHFIKTRFFFLMQLANTIAFVKNEKRTCFFKNPFSCFFFPFIFCHFSYSGVHPWVSALLRYFKYRRTFVYLLYGKAWCCCVFEISYGIFCRAEVLSTVRCVITASPLVCFFFFVVKDVGAHKTYFPTPRLQFLSFFFFFLQLILVLCGALPK